MCGRVRVGGRALARHCGSARRAAPAQVSAPSDSAIVSRATRAYVYVSRPLGARLGDFRASRRVAASARAPHASRETKEVDRAKHNVKSDIGIPIPAANTLHSTLTLRGHSQDVIVFIVPRFTVVSGGATASPPGTAGRARARAAPLPVSEISDGVPFHVPFPRSTLDLAFWSHMWTARMDSGRAPVARAPFRVHRDMPDARRVHSTARRTLRCLVARTCVPLVSSPHLVLCGKMVTRKLFAASSISGVVFSAFSTVASSPVTPETYCARSTRIRAAGVSVDRPPPAGHARHAQAPTCSCTRPFR